MAISFQCRLEVKARAEKLWDILTDVESWPQWQGTHFVKLHTPGRIMVGHEFTAELGGVRWEVKVIKAERPQTVIWVGKRPGLKGIHEWEFKEVEGTTIAITRESMTGWLLLLTYPIVKQGLYKTDKKWLADLKERAERA